MVFVFADEDAMEKSVSVLLDGQESELDFLDPESSTATYVSGHFVSQPNERSKLVAAQRSQ